MDPHPPFDHPRHRRAHPGHHYPDPHLAGGVGGGAAPARSRYDYDSHALQYHPSDHQHHHPRIHHQPPPSHHCLDAPHYAPLPLRAPPETYSPPPYRSLSPHRHYHPPHHGGDDFRAADEVRRAPSRHHHHHQMQEHIHHHHHQPQLPWEEPEEERRLQLRLSTSDSRKRRHCALHDAGDLDSTSSSGPPPRCQRQRTSYSPDENFVDRTSSHSGYSRYEGFVMHSESNRKMQTSASTMLQDSPHKFDAGYLRRAPQKSAPARVSVWQRIEENPSVYTPSSPHQLPKQVYISPSKTKKAGYASKELTGVISLDCKANSPSKTKSTGSSSKELPSVISRYHKVKSVNGKNTDDNGGTKKSTGKKSEKVLASVLVKPSPESKEKGMVVKQAARNPDKVQNNVPGFSIGSAGLNACPGMGVKKVKKIVIKKIVRKVGYSDKQTSSSVIPEQKDGVDANECEKEEGEITTSSYEKDDSSAHNLISDIARVCSSLAAETEQNDSLINPCKRSAVSAIESVGTFDTASVGGSQNPEKEDDRSLMKTSDTNATSVVDSTQVLDTIGSEHPEDRGCMDSGGQGAALLCENGNSHMEGDDLAVSGAINVASNSSRRHDTMKLHGFDVSEDMKGNSAACVNGVKDDAQQILESTDSWRENRNVFNDSNGESDLFTNNSFRSPSTAEASVTTCKDVHRKKDNKVYVASLGDSMETYKIAEPTMTQDTHREEGAVMT